MSDDGGSTVEPVLPHGLGRDLTQVVRRGELDPVFGRGRDIEQVLAILTRKTRNWPVLVSESSADITDVVGGVAEMLADRDNTDSLARRSVFQVDVGNMARMQWDDVILVVDGSFPETIAELLNKPDSLLIIMATPDQYRLLQRDPALAIRLQTVHVVEPSPTDTVEQLRDARDYYEEHHGLDIHDDALAAATVLARRFVTDLPLPDSAFDVLDEACAMLRLRGLVRPASLSELDQRIVEIRRDKLARLDAEDFDAVLTLQDNENAMMSEREELGGKWRSGELAGVVREVDEQVVVEVVAARVGLTVEQVAAVLPSFAPVKAEVAVEHTLLADQPAEEAADDLLGAVRVAKGIAEILARAASPFVLAVDGGWGVGKSTLLRRIEAELPDPTMIPVRFNAWTARGENALESLIKSVISELDPNVLRRWLRKLAKRQRAVGLARVGLAVVARFFGMTRLIDELWTRLSVNASSRNEFRTVVQQMLADWLNRPGQPRRTLVVFIDDLDRCADDVVVGVCEAVKLYLDAPGLVFVIGCDLSVLARGVAAEARGGEGEGRTYLEKIVQVVHRVPAPDRAGVANLVRGYADRAGIGAILDDAMVTILSERTGRNPRRIKRIVNSFVLEHHLNPAWRQPPLGSTALIAVIILQHLYPQFYERLAGQDAGDDPIGEFLDYAAVRARSGDTPSVADTWWSTAGRVFRRYGAPPPPREAGADRTAEIEAVERILPPWFPVLALHAPLLALLRDIGDADTRLAVRAQLVNRPLTSGAFPDEP